MKRNNFKKCMAAAMAATMTLSLAACGSQDNAGSSAAANSAAGSSTESKAESSAAAETEKTVPTIDQIKVGEDYQDITATIKILTDRTDIVDTVYAGYAEQFNQIYPNIKVEYDAITDYAQTVTLKLTNGDWGDICFIPDSVSQSEMQNYFIPFGSFETLDPIYNFMSEDSYEGTVYGISNGGNANGVVYNKRIWEEAGITELPSTPDEFLEDLQKIKDNTDAIPLYTNFNSGWTMGQWNQYVGCSTSGDADYKNQILVHTANPFVKNDENSGPYSVYYVLYESVARGLVEEDPASCDWESSKARINTGEIATMVLGSWAVQQCKDAAGNPDDVAYMPFPVTVNGKRYAGAGGNYSYGINKETSVDNQIAAMVYVKWLIEESSIYKDEGSIPARKDGEFPEALSGFQNVELLSDSPALEGEEGLYDNINNESEVLTDYGASSVLEAALYKNKTLDDVMADWNDRWSKAMTTLGVEAK